MEKFFKNVIRAGLLFLEIVNENKIDNNLQFILLNKLLYYIYDGGRDFNNFYKKIKLNPLVYRKLLKQLEKNGFIVISEKDKVITEIVLNYQKINKYYFGNEEE